LKRVFVSLFFCHLAGAVGSAGRSPLRPRRPQGVDPPHTHTTAGLAGYTAISVLYASAESLWQLGVFRFLQGISLVMVSPLAQAYVGDLTPRGKEGQYTNLFCSSQFIGMAIGPLLGGGIGAAWSYQAAFYVMGALSLVSLFLGSAHRTRRPQSSRGNAARADRFNTLGGELRRRERNVDSA